MTKFKIRIKQISEKNSRLILANDYPPATGNLEPKTISNIKKLGKYLCGLKINFHLLLPLSSKEIMKINKIAHEYDLVTIADIKLNDIENTNKNTTEILWKLGFDAVIVNPIMGKKNLKKIIDSTHKKNKGVITLCHMSTPKAKSSYEINVNSSTKEKKLYELFLEWAISENADGIIAGATFPKIISHCKKKAKNNLEIYSPGIGAQGGEIKNIINVGADFFIVGRTILNSKDPVLVAKKLQLESLGK